MRKHVVFTVVNRNYGIIIFYYKSEHRIHYLFHTRFRKKIHEFFRYGKSISELHRQKNWHRNILLSNLIEGQLNSKLKQVIKEEQKCRMKP